MFDRKLHWEQWNNIKKVVKLKRKYFVNKLLQQQYQIKQNMKMTSNVIIVYLIFLTIFIGLKHFFFKFWSAWSFMSLWSH